MNDKTLFAWTAACVALSSACGAPDGVMSAGAESEDRGVSSASSNAEEPTWFFVDNEDPGFQLVSDTGHGFDRLTKTWTSQSHSGEVWWNGQDFLSTSAGWADATHQALSALAVWTAKVPEGRYDVFVRVHARPQNTTMATYCIVRGASGQQVDCYGVNQRTGESGWRHLAIVETPDTLEVWLDPGASIVGSGSVLADSVAFRRIDGSEGEGDRRRTP